MLALGLIATLFGTLVVTQPASAQTSSTSSSFVVDAAGAVTIFDDNTQAGFVWTKTFAPGRTGIGLQMYGVDEWLRGSIQAPVTGFEFWAKGQRGGTTLEAIAGNGQYVSVPVVRDGTWRKYVAAFPQVIPAGTNLAFTNAEETGSVVVDDFKLLTTLPPTPVLPTTTLVVTTAPTTPPAVVTTATTTTIPATTTTTAAPTTTAATTTTAAPTTTSPSTTAAPTSTIATTTTLAPFPVSAATATLDSSQGVPILNETLNGGFRYGENGYSIPAAGQLVPGHTGFALRMNAAISGAIYGSSSYAIRGIEFWAKAPTDPLTMQWTLFGPVATPLIADGAWRRYITQFPTDVAPGTALRFQSWATGTGNKSLDIDDIRLITTASPELTTTTTTVTPTTTTIAKFPNGPAPVTDAQGGIVIVSEAIASGFAFARDGSAVAEPTVSNVTAGRSGLGLVLGGPDRGMVVGSVSSVVRGVEVWLNAPASSTVTGWALEAYGDTTVSSYNSVTPIADGQWRKYILQFPIDIPASKAITVRAYGYTAGSTTRTAVIVDDVRLITSTSTELTLPTTSTTSTLPTTTTSTTTTTTSPTTTTTSTTITTTSTTRPPVAVDAGPFLVDSDGLVRIFDEAIHAGFSWGLNYDYTAQSIALSAPGRTGLGLRMPGSTDTLRGVTKAPVRGFEFWAIAPADAGISAMVGTEMTNAQQSPPIQIIRDGVWRKYVGQFPTDIPANTNINFRNKYGSAEITIDDFRLITTNSPQLTTTTTTSTTLPTTTTTTIPAFPIGVGAPALDAGGGVIIVGESIAQGFSYGLCCYWTQQPGKVTAGRSGSGLVIDAAPTGAVSGSLAQPVRGVEFWAKVPIDPLTTNWSVSYFWGNTFTQGTLTADGTWRKYTFQFPNDVPSGTALSFRFTATGSGVKELALDDLRLITTSSPEMSTTTTTTSTSTTSTTTTSTTTTTLPPFPLGSSVASVDASGALFILDDYLNGGFQYNEKNPSTGSQAVTQGRAGAGRSSSRSLLVSADRYGALVGSVPFAVRGIEFWARVPVDPLSTQWSFITPATDTSLVADGTWRKYTWKFSTDLAPGIPLRFQGGVNGTGQKTFELDDVRLITPSAAEYHIPFDPPGTPPLLDTAGDLVVLDGAMRSGFRTLDAVTGAPSGSDGIGVGRNGAALLLNVNDPAPAVIKGNVSKTVRTVAFWAKSANLGALNASSGATNLGTVQFLGDGAWHRYVMPFPVDVTSGSPVTMKLVSNGASYVYPVTIDSLTLIARPFVAVAVSSTNGYEAPTQVTAKMTGFWSTSPHYAKVQRTADGGAPCDVACSRQLIPTNGQVSFSLGVGVYRVLVEADDASGTVGVSSTFTVSAPTTTTTSTTTTTTTTLPPFPVATNDVWNGLGDIVVLDDAFHSSFTATAATSNVTQTLRAAVGRNGKAAVLNPTSDALRGTLKASTTAIRFWAKGNGTTISASSGGTTIGNITVSGDAWSFYALNFSSARAAGQELVITGAGPSVLLDDMGLYTPPPPVITTPTTAPPGYYQNRTVVDWRVKVVCLSFQNPDGTGPVSYQCELQTLEGTAPSVPMVNPTSTAAELVGIGGIEEYPYGSGVYGKRHTEQVWIPGIATPTVPPAPRYVSAILTVGGLDYGNGPGWTVQFGTPPTINFVQGMGIASIRNLFADAGGIETSTNVFTFYSSTPPTTTIPPQTTTTVPATTIPPTPQGRPDPFSGYPNLLKNRYTGTCLIPGAQVGCESGSQQLTFTAYPGPNGQRAYQIRHSGQCLSVDFGAPDTQIQLPTGKYASKIAWLPCNNTNGYEGTWIPEHATNSNGLDWYIMMPVDNRPGIDDPCLNFNTNPASTQMLIEYTCHRDGTSTEEHWAPQETYWTPTTTTGTVTTTTVPSGVTVTTTPSSTGTTTSLPPAPTGAHLFEDGVLTPLQSVTDLSCLTIDSLNTFGTSLAGDCESFIPELNAGSWLLHRALDYDNCLTNTGYQLSTAPCATAAHWTDRNIDGLKFAIRPTSDETMCLELGGIAAFLRLGCTTPTNKQLWYDAKTKSDVDSLAELLVSKGTGEFSDPKSFASRFPKKSEAERKQVRQRVTDAIGIRIILTLDHDALGEVLQANSFVDDSGNLHLGAGYPRSAEVLRLEKLFKQHSGWSVADQALRSIALKVNLKNELVASIALWVAMSRWHSGIDYWPTVGSEAATKRMQNLLCNSGVNPQACQDLRQASLEKIDLAIGSIPILGAPWVLGEAFVGHQLLSGRQLTVAERVLTGAVAAVELGAIASSISRSARTGYAEFFTVQDQFDAARLRSGGTPWPTAPSKSALGEGLYSWTSAEEAAAYRTHLLGKSDLVPGTRFEIVKFRVSLKDLKLPKYFVVDSLPGEQADAWMLSQSKLTGGQPNHGFGWVLRGTNFGIENYFSVTALAAMKSFEFF
jgi:hypothetical protein